MARFRARLESQDHMRDNGEPHFRDVLIGAEDEAAAVAVLARREYEAAAFQLRPDMLKECEDAEADGTATKQQVTQLATHRQSQPYVLAGIKEA